MQQLKAAIPMGVELPEDPFVLITRIQESIEAGETPAPPEGMPALPGGLELPTIPALPEFPIALPGTNNAGTAGVQVFPGFPTLPLPPLNHSGVPTRQLSGLPTTPGLNHATMPTRTPTYTQTQGVYRETMPYLNRIF